jgi:hypothetical protein
MRRAAIVLAFLTAVVLAMAMLAAGVAGASPRAVGSGIRAAVTAGTVHLGKPGRYSVDLAIPGDGAAVLSVHHVTQEELGGTERTSYAVRPAATLASGELRADFGAVGTVALRFEPSGDTKVGRVPKHCRGRPPRTERGTYRGQVELHGEGGYFQVRRVTAKGTRRRSFRLVCSGGTARVDTPASLAAYVEPDFRFALAEVDARLELLAESEGRVLAYRSENPRHNIHGTFRTGAFEWQGEMAVGRYSHTLATGGFGTSAPGRQPATAEAFDLSAPSPAGPTRPVYVLDLGWTAPLTFHFPGLEVTLDGSEAQTNLCIGSAPESQIPCPTHGPPLLIPAQFAR